VSGGRGAAVALVAVLIACEGAYLTAPPGSSISVFANPTLIPAHGGVAELSAVVTEAVGTAVPDGTSVFWSTNLGQIDRETRTTNGIARNRLVSDSRSGLATVVAVSGGGTAPGPLPSTSPSPSPSASPSAAPSSPPPGGGTVSGQVQVSIGNILVVNVLLRAVPPRITNSQSTHLIATVLDARGDPVANVPVFFEVVSNTDLEFLDSGGTPIFTNNNGEAEDVLRTRRTASQNAAPIRVRAVATGNGVFVPSAELPIPVVF
jgi:hypothetical protein